MINLLLGPPGGGKSYEAVVYHVLPALAAGRLVITNLPLDLERIAQIDPSFPALIVTVDNRKADFHGEARIVRAFSTMADYAHPWRHPVSGAGPLYVIDECHLAMPRGSTAIDVEEWYSLHRHESADVLLITQSYGKVSKSVIDLVQICYRVRKATAFGTQKQYVRKVQDGVRGDVVNTSIRTYEKRYFGLYKSHTRGGGSELAANDIVPFWKRWPVIGSAVFFTAAVLIFGFGPGINPLKVSQKEKPKDVKPVRVVETINGQVVSDTAAPKAQDTQATQAKASAEPVHPYSGRTLHIIGSVFDNKLPRILFAVAQNGQIVSTVDSWDLEKLGYKLNTPTPCAITVEWEGHKKWIICDAPQVSINPVGSDSEKRDGGALAKRGGAATPSPLPGGQVDTQSGQNSSI